MVTYKACVISAQAFFMNSAQIEALILIDKF
jgi:hypothetical protein